MGNGEPQGKSPARRKRVERLKRLIVISILVLIFVPLAVAIYFGCEAHMLKQKLQKTSEELNYYLELQSQAAFNEEEVKTADGDVTEAVTVIKDKKDYSSLSLEDIEKLSLSDEELYDGYRKVYLTFDDGPSPNTDDILDVLNSYGVKATFFVVRRDGRNNEKLYQRIVDEGHSLGMHSSTHVYRDLYSSLDSFTKDTTDLRNFLYMVTGVESNIYRFPGGSSNRVSAIDMRVFANALKEEGITYFDWNISSYDASATNVSKDQIVRSVTSQLKEYNEAVILFHDLDTKNSTVEALPEIIEYIQAMDHTVILPITKGTNPITHLSIKEGNS